jgi:hypothetical protein
LRGSDITALQCQLRGQQMQRGMFGTAGEGFIQRCLCLAGAKRNVGQAMLENTLSGYSWKLRR